MILPQQPLINIWPTLICTHVHHSLAYQQSSVSWKVCSWERNHFKKGWEKLLLLKAVLEGSLVNRTQYSWFESHLQRFFKPLLWNYTIPAYSGQMFFTVTDTPGSDPVIGSIFLGHLLIFDRGYLKVAIDFSYIQTNFQDDPVSAG